LSATLPNAHFILKPDIDLTKLHTLGKNGFYLLDKFFLNSACLTGSACGLMERADIQAISSRLSKSYTPFRLIRYGELLGQEMAKVFATDPSTATVVL